MYQNNVHISLILIIVLIILLFLILTQYSIGLAQTNDNYLASLYNKGNALSALGRYEEAIQYYDKVLAIDPNDVDALTNKGVALSALGKSEEAIQYYDKALAIDPNYTLSLTNKGIDLGILGKYDEAIQYYDKALAIDPNYTLSLTNKGVALSALGKSEEAITYYDKVLAIDPNDVYALTNKGIDLSALGKSEEAIQYYDKALAIDPNNIDALNNKGNTLSALGRYEEAIEQYDKALGTKPIKDIQYSTRDWKIEPDYYISISQTMDFIGFHRYNEFNGLQYIALSKDSENTIIIIIVNKGIAQYKAGRYMEANNNFDTVLKMDKNYVAGLYYKGLCLDKLGQANQASSYKNRATTIDPTYKGEIIDTPLIKPPLEQLFDTR
jgi:superkiller protein 3